MPPDESVDCPVCKMPLVTGCRNAPDVRGGGIIHKVRGEDLVAVPCPNMEIVRLKQRLCAVDPRLLKVKHEPETPLFQRGVVDRTEDNLLFRATTWSTFLSHFKWVVGSKDFFVRVITDMTLVNVYVGNTNIKSRLKSQLEEGSEFIVSNSIEDLLTNLDLVVIRLGHLVNFNKAAANILHEALLLRRGQGKPVWLVEPPEQMLASYRKSEFGISSGMPCCNDDVLALVNAHFECIEFEPIEGEEDSPGFSVDESQAEVTVEAPSEFGEMVPDEVWPVETKAKAGNRGLAKSLEESLEKMLNPPKRYPKKQRF